MNTSYIKTKKFSVVSRLTKLHILHYSEHLFLREMLEPLVLLVLRVLLDCRECLVSAVPLVFQD